MTNKTRSQIPSFLHMRNEWQYKSILNKKKQGIFEASGFTISSESRHNTKKKLFSCFVVIKPEIQSKYINVLIPVMPSNMSQCAEMKSNKRSKVKKLLYIGIMGMLHGFQIYLFRNP